MLDTAARLVPDTVRSQALILWFDEVGIADIHIGRREKTHPWAR